MKLLRKLTAFILAFSLLAGTVAVVSASVYSEDSFVPLENETIAQAIEPEFPYHSGKTELASTAAAVYTPRLTAPAKSNKYYYSDLNPFYKYGWGMPNCTCYAWGRAYEILGKEPDLCPYSAYLWYGHNKDNKIYTYGTTPKLGAIACWVYSSGTSGHVAVVEKIVNNTITFSNSAYSGENFYLSTAPVKDPSNGNKTWIFQGYIYLGDYVADPNAPSTGDTSSTIAGDVYRITSKDGVNLRKGYGTSYAVLGGITYGQDVTVTKTKKNEGYTWGYTTYNGVSGWFVTDFAKLIYTKSADADYSAEPTTAATTKATAKATAAPTFKATTAPTTKSTKTPTVKATTAPTLKATTAPTVKPAAPTEPVIEDATVPAHMLIMGDLDEDNELTIMDATRLQMVLAELIIPTEYMLIVGDFDGDSELSIMDAYSIRFHLAFLEK